MVFNGFGCCWRFCPLWDQLVESGMQNVTGKKYELNFVKFKVSINDFSLFLQRKILSSSLGFAAGVMLAASYWSLLAPAVELSKASEFWNSSEVLSLVPVAGGFFLGALFVYIADLALDSLGVTNPTISLGP